jgi:hypothetical protein
VALGTIVSSVVCYLRQGYPQGVPEQDYIPLLALLRRRLTDDEVAEVADGLIDAGDTESAAALRSAISRVTAEPPRDEDVRRVSAQLAAAGWPLASQEELFGATEPG